MKFHLGVKQGLLSNKSPFFSSQSAGEWIPSMINHFYWSVVSCNGNGKELVERFLSVIHHVCNRHTFAGNRYYYVCSHSQCDKKEARTKKWMKPCSPSYKAPKEVIMDKVLMKDMEKMNKNIYTTYLEVFHSLKIWYIPKSIFFEQEKMVSGAKFAAQDHNTNITREQVRLIDVLLHYYVLTQSAKKY